MLKILQHNVWGLEESIVASALPMMTDVDVAAFNSRIADLRDYLTGVLKTSVQGGRIYLETDLQGVIRQGDRVEAEISRARRLARARSGSGHDCFLKGIVVQALIEYPAHWSVQFQRYHFSDFVSSQSTMHCLLKMDVRRVLERTDCGLMIVNEVVRLVDAYKAAEEGSAEQQDLWYELIDSLPRGFLLTARITTNYLQLKNILSQRRGHKLREWRVFCDWVESLPLWHRLFDDEVNAEVKA